MAESSMIQAFSNSSRTHGDSTSVHSRSAQGDPFLRNRDSEPKSAVFGNRLPLSFTAQSAAHERGIVIADVADEARPHANAEAPCASQQGTPEYTRRRVLPDRSFGRARAGV